MQKKFSGLLIAVLLLSIAFSGCLEGNNNTSNVEQEAQQGSLEVEVQGHNGEFVPDIEVSLWTEENFGVNPDLIDYTKTTARGTTNLTGKVLFSDLDAGNYVVNPHLSYFTDEEDALSHVKHVTINASEVTYEIFIYENFSRELPSPEEGGIIINQNRIKQYGLTQEIAEQVLATGTKIIDTTNDWTSTGNSWDNPSFYPLDFVDLKEVDIGLDNNFLYVKVVFDGILPSKENWPVVNGDNVIMSGYTLNIDMDNNKNTGCICDGGVELKLGAVIKKELGLVVANNYDTDPSGLNDPEEARYLGHYNDAVWFAGPGYDYVINVYPLINLNISKGMDVTVIIWTEAMSESYHHTSFDIIGDKIQDSYVMTLPIKIKLGENRTIS